MKANFEELCKVLVRTEGNPSCKDVIKCGYGFEHFLRISDYRVDRKKIAERAADLLYEKGYRSINGIILKPIKKEKSTNVQKTEQ